jgi:hypothetical protein
MKSAFSFGISHDKADCPAILDNSATVSAATQRRLSVQMPPMVQRLATSANVRIALDGATEEERTVIWNAVTEALQPHTEADGIIRLRNEAICAVAW